MPELRCTWLRRHRLPLPTVLLCCLLTAWFSRTLEGAGGSGAALTAAQARVRELEHRLAVPSSPRPAPPASVAFVHCGVPLTAVNGTREEALVTWSTSLDALPVLDSNAVTPSTTAWGPAGRRHSKTGDIAVVLNAFRRCHMLNFQLHSVKQASRHLAASNFVHLHKLGYQLPHAWGGGAEAPSFNVTRIIVLQNGALCSMDEAAAAHPDVDFIRSSWVRSLKGAGEGCC